MQKWDKGVFYPLLNTGVPGALGREIIGVPERSLPGSQPGLASAPSRAVMDPSLWHHSPFSLCLLSLHSPSKHQKREKQLSPSLADPRIPLGRIFRTHNPLSLPSEASPAPLQLHLPLPAAPGTNSLSQEQPGNGAALHSQPC